MLETPEMPKPSSPQNKHALMLRFEQDEMVFLKAKAESDRRPLAQLLRVWIQQRMDDEGYSQKKTKR
jgi:hypothetical protein